VHGPKDMETGAWKWPWRGSNRVGNLSPMDFLHGFLLFDAALAAGVINSVAGGGSFFTFPALVMTGMPSILANATSTVAVWPGTVASVGAYRKDILRERRLVPGLVAVSAIGGLLGAVVLLRTPQPVFDRILPWLLLSATLIFVFGAKVTAWIRGRPHGDGTPAKIGVLGWSIQLLIASYAAGDDARQPLVRPHLAQLPHAVERLSCHSSPRARARLAARLTVDRCRAILARGAATAPWIASGDRLAPA